MTALPTRPSPPTTSPPCSMFLWRPSTPGARSAPARLGFRVGKLLRYDPTAVHNWITNRMAADAA